MPASPSFAALTRHAKTPNRFLSQPLTNVALKHRVGLEANGIRTPGGFGKGFRGREDIQLLLQGLGFDWASLTAPDRSGWALGAVRAIHVIPL